MNNPTGRWVILYGAFLIVIGLIAFFSNPERAITAIIFGGGFGLIMIVWGFLMQKGITWSSVGALVTSIVFALGLGYRAVVGWMAFAAGETERLVAPLSISVMLAGTVVILIVLLRHLSRRKTS